MKQTAEEKYHQKTIAETWLQKLLLYRHSQEMSATYLIFRKRKQIHNLMLKFVTFKHQKQFTI